MIKIKQKKIRNIILILFVGFMSMDLAWSSRREYFRMMGKEENWKRYIRLFQENKLPLLEKEKEEEILRETDRILREEKSLFGAYLYLIKSVADYENGYLLYGNERIKKKLVELMKMRVQCALKKEIRGAKKRIAEKTSVVISEEEKEYIKRQKNNLEILEKQLQGLIEKDGDLCDVCYLDDKEEIKAKSGGGEDEGDPGGYSWNISILYSVALSCFSGDVYEYLCVGLSRGLDYMEVSDFSYMYYPYAVSVSLATVYANQFLEDLEKGYYKNERIFRENGSCVTVGEVIQVVKDMIFLNPEFVRQEKQRLKRLLLYYANQEIEEQNSERSRLLRENSVEAIGKDLSKWTDLVLTFTFEINVVRGMIEIYEQIGEKEDIEDIKRLGEGICLDYPVRESKREYDEKDKERYLQRVKELQDRVKVLVEKLSQQ